MTLDFRTRAECRKDGWLYFDTEDFCIYREKTDSYESFIPTKGEEGWILYWNYSTYDSEGPSTGLDYEVIDIYPTEEEAEANAKKVGRYSHGKPLKADGSKVHDQWTNWGISLENVYIAPVGEIKQKKQGGRRRIY